MPGAGQELLDLLDERVGVAEERQVVDALEFDQPRARDGGGDRACALDRHVLVAAMEHERRHPDFGEHVRDVRLADRLDQRAAPSRGSRQPARKRANTSR